jgi:hypothetical protein
METSDQIERHIRETRSDLGDNLNELGDKVKKTLDWRVQFEERPGTMLGLAFGAVSFCRRYFPQAVVRAPPTPGREARDEGMLGLLLDHLPHCRRANQAKHGKAWKPWPMPWSVSL